MTSVEHVRSTTNRRCDSCRKLIVRDAIYTRVTLEHTEHVPHIGERTLRESWHLHDYCRGEQVEDERP